MLFTIATATTILATLAAAVPTGDKPGVTLFSSITPIIDSSKCVDVAWAKYADGTALQLATCSGNDAQKFMMSGGLSNNYASVSPKAAPLMCLDAGENPGSGSLVHLQACSFDAPQQMWAWHASGSSKLKLNGGQGLNLCLDVKDGATADGSPLQVWECDDSYPNQAFTFTS